MNLESKNIIWGVVIFIAIIAGLWGVWRLTTVPADSQDQAIDLNITANDHTKGASDGSVVLVEYSDLQCPACQAFAPITRQLVDANPDTLTFVYRHFPLAQHQNAEAAAYAAEAAGKQGTFFEYHDILFDRQEDWAENTDPTKTFLAYAEELELDIDQFTADMGSETVRAKVDTDLNSGITAGVDSTPSFFLNGKRVRNPNSLEAFQDLIDAELASTATEGHTDESDEATEEGSMEGEQ